MGYAAASLEEYGIDIKALGIKNKVINGGEYWGHFFDHIFNTRITKMESDKEIDSLVEEIENMIYSRPIKESEGLRKILKKTRELIGTIYKYDVYPNQYTDNAEINYKIDLIYENVRDYHSFVEDRLEKISFYRKFIANAQRYESNVKLDIQSLENLKKGYDDQYLIKMGSNNKKYKCRIIPPETLEHAIASKKRELMIIKKLLKNYKRYNKD